MVSMLALNWCVRYPSGHNYGQFSPGEIAGPHQIYARYIPKLKSGLEIYGFVQDRWDWLIRYSKHNLHDLIGLTSILLEGRIFPLDAQPPLTMGSREDFFRSLLSKFPVCGERDLKKRILATGGLSCETGIPLSSVWLSGFANHVHGALLPDLHAGRNSGRSEQC